LNLKSIFLNLLFPIQCLGCNQESVWICKNCQNKIHLQKYQICPNCKKTKTEGNLCGNCQNTKIYFDKLLVAAKYEKEHLIQKVIKTFKYRFIKDLNKFLGDFLSDTIRKYIKNYKNYILIPIPLHLKKEKWRGFNQAELLTDTISENLQIFIDKNLIKRIKYQKSQAELDRDLRLKNLHNAFQIEDKIKALNKKFILIDDIATTGTTLNECAKMLKTAGAIEVVAVVIGRGE